MPKRGRPPGTPMAYWTPDERVRLIEATAELKNKFPGRTLRAIVNKMLEVG